MESSRVASVVLIGCVAVGTAYCVAGEYQPGEPFDGGRSYTTHLPGEPDELVADVRVEDLEQAPPWRLEDENPPLSARDALKLAIAERDRLEAVQPEQNRCKWWLEPVQLHPAGQNRWYWVVTYCGFPPGVDGGRPYELVIPVLMDGRTIAPRKKPK
jgi:hypothetical protein